MRVKSLSAVLRQRPVVLGGLWSVMTMAIILVGDAWFDTSKRLDHAGFTFLLLLIAGQGWAFWFRRHLNELDTHARS